MFNRTVPLLIAAALAVATGCTHLRKSPEVDASKPLPTLVTSASIVTQDNSQQTLLDAAVSMAQQARLGEFGAKAVEQITPWLKSHGFELKFEPERAKKLDQLEFIKIDNDAAVITGMWTEPRGSHHYFGNHSVFERDHYVKVANLLKADGHEGFLAMRITTGLAASWVFMRAVYVMADIMIIDENGKELLDARGYGEGDLGFMFPNKNPENLTKALNRALASLQEAKVEPLK